MGTLRPQTVGQIVGECRACFSHAPGVSNCSARPCCISTEIQALQSEDAGKLRGTAKGQTEAALYLSCNLLRPRW